MGEVQELTLIDAAPATEADAQALCVELNMDENGLVTWLPVENADADKLEIDKNGSMNMKTLYIQDTSFRLLEHYSLNVYPLFADGTEGISMRSAVFGGLAEEVSPLDHSAYQVYGLIPAIDPASFVTAKDGTPFNEYIIIDLFTAEGLHQYDAPRCELDGAKGVRVYHVNSAMERRELTYELAGDTVFPIGTIHIANEYKEPDLGQYLIELILRGGDNTFTDTSNVKKLRTNLLPKDLFTAGDVFTAEKYDEFFYEGKMDDGLPFGYTVKVVSIETNDAGETTAVISVTRQN